MKIAYLNMHTNEPDEEKKNNILKKRRKKKERRAYLMFLCKRSVYSCDGEVGGAAVGG